MEGGERRRLALESITSAPSGFAVENEHCNRFIPEKDCLKKRVERAERDQSNVLLMLGAVGAKRANWTSTAQPVSLCVPSWFVDTEKGFQKMLVNIKF